MRETKMFLGRVLAMFLLVTTGTVFAGAVQQAQPDNSAVNTRDRKASQPTVDQSKNSTSDVVLARQIRRDIGKDKTVSVSGHNVKIIAQGGTVTLKGSFHTEDEKNLIAKYAQKYAGDGNVTNELSVKSDSK